MRIAVIGSRGIPNHYGGFEECAAQLSKRWVTSGHEVVVYNSSLHPYTELSWEGVELRRMNDPEDRLGTFGQFIYDLNCPVFGSLKLSLSRMLGLLMMRSYNSFSEMVIPLPSVMPA